MIVALCIVSSFCLFGGQGMAVHLISAGVGIIGQIVKNYVS